MTPSERYRAAVNESRWTRAEEIAYRQYRPINGPRNDEWLNRFATISRLIGLRHQMDEAIQEVREEAQR